MGLGIDIDNGETVSLLMYADDIVLLADNENDLQQMLNALLEWCRSNYMSINTNKTNIVHYRPKSNSKTCFNFTFGDVDLMIKESYLYLGLVLEEHLNFNVTASFVAKSASRALGLLICKFKSIGGMPFKVYTKLYDSLVWSIVAYGAAIWGTQTFSCIDAVQNRAMRVYLDTTKTHQ